MKWIVEGADAKTGAEALIEVEAPDEVCARLEAKKNRVLVSEIHASPVLTAEAIAANPQLKYSDIVGAAKWVRALGFAFRLIGAVFIVLSLTFAVTILILAFTNKKEGSSTATSPMMIIVVPQLLFGMLMVAVGSIFRLFAGIGDAVREIAINSRH